MKSFFDDGAYQELCNRIELLSADSKPIWGKMNTPQMMYHCQKPLNIALEKDNYGLRPNWLVKVLFKKSLYSDTPWRKNMPTPSKLKVNDERDFHTEKNSLLNLLNELNSQKSKTEWHDHPAFGEMSKDQWGKMQYKHLDHHLKQFGF